MMSHPGQRRSPEPERASPLSQAHHKGRIGIWNVYFSRRDVRSECEMSRLQHRKSSVWENQDVSLNGRRESGGPAPWC